MHRPLWCALRAVEGSQGIAAPARPQHPIIWLWDGTDVPPFQPTTVVGHLRDHGGQDEVAGNAYTPLPLFPDDEQRIRVVPDLPKLGTALPVVMHYRSLEELQPLDPTSPARQHPSPVSWIKLRNVLVSPERSGHICLHYHAKSRWSRLPDETDALQVSPSAPHYTGCTLCRATIGQHQG